MRKLFVALLVLLILLFAGYFVFSLKEKVEHNVSSKGINAIPYNAVAILRIQSPLNKWDKLLEGNYGKQLNEIKEIRGLGETLAKFQKASTNNPVFKKLLSDNPIYLSAHMTGVQSYNFLVVSNFNPDDKKMFIDAFPKELKDYKVSARKYEECHITDLVQKNGKGNLSIVFENNLIIISTSSILIEDAILQLKHRIPLNEKKEFAKLFKTADLSLDANLFVNYSELGSFLNVFGRVNNGAKQKFNHFGNWMEVDLKISDNGIMMNGFSLIKDSSSTFLSNLKGLSPSKINATSIVPDNISFMSSLSFENYQEYHEKFKEHLQSQQKLYQYEKNIADFNKTHKLNLNEDLFKWIGSEFCFFMTKGDQENPMENACVAIHSNNIELAMEKLKKIEKATGHKTDSSVFSNHAIYNLGLPNLLRFALGDYFNGNKRSYYTILEDYVVFGNDVGNLKNVINSYVRRKTLIKNKNFSTFYEHFSTKSNYFVYINPKKASNFWSYFLTKDLAKVFNDNQDIITGFEAVGFQAVSHNNLYYTNIYSNYKVIQESADLNLITFELDTSYSHAPWLVKNHYTNETEMLLQDDRNTLYLINNVGIILWKKSLQNKIIGNVQSIDRYHNKKFQYLFGTGKKLHLIDRNGNNVEGFPVKLKKQQTEGIAVFDYDNNKKYRILVPAGKYLTCYNKEGKVVKGWAFNGANSGIVNTPELLQVGNKDYIIFSDRKGNVYTLNRKGEQRIKYHNKLPKEKQNYEIYLNGSLSNSGIITTDTSGTIMFLKMTDEISSITTRNFTKDHTFYLGQLTSSSAPDILYYEDEEVYAYKLSKNKIMSIKNLDFVPSFGIKTHLINKEGMRIITMTDRANNKIYAFNQEGELLNNFPIEGNTDVLITDLNDDGKYKMIIGNKEGYLFVYTLF
ncbi:MAG: hypothetical protein ACJA0Q_001192 [Saprospiraceae bacterium]|jgi:hypothetical protein